MKVAIADPPYLGWGAKPAEFVWWVLDLLNAEPTDEIDDLFPGSGAVGAALAGWREAHLHQPSSLPLFAETA